MLSLLTVDCGVYGDDPCTIPSLATAAFIKEIEDGLFFSWSMKMSSTPHIPRDELFTMDLFCDCLLLAVALLVIGIVILVFS
jgi:hypothetical protein